MAKFAKSQFIRELLIIAETYDPTHNREHHDKGLFVRMALQERHLPAHSEMETRAIAVVSAHFTKANPLQVLVAVERAWEYYDSLPVQKMPRRADGPIEPALEEALLREGTGIGPKSSFDRSFKRGLGAD